MPLRVITKTTRQAVRRFDFLSYRYSMNVFALGMGQLDFPSFRKAASMCPPDLRNRVECQRKVVSHAPTQKA